MVDQGALSAAFEHYAQALLNPYDVGEMLYQLTDQVVEVLDVAGAGVSIARNGSLAFVAATSCGVAAVEHHQSSTGEGPCHCTFLTGEGVRIEDLAATDDWPDYRDLTLAQGYRAVATLPMPVATRRIGVLDLYRTGPHGWRDEDIRVAQVLANMASGYVLNNIQLSESRNVARQLQRTLDSRVIVEQATGVLCGRHDITPEEAIARLRTHGRTFGAGLQDVCQRVVSGDLPL